MPLQLTPLRGEEFIRKVLQGEKDFRRIQLERGDLSIQAGYPKMQEYLQRKDKIHELEKSPLYFTEAELGGFRARKIYFPHIQAEKANFEGASLPEAYLWHAELRQANFRKADLTGAHFNGVGLQQARLEDTCLIDASLGGANFAEAILRQAYLNRADLDEANFGRADLRGVRGLEYTNVEDAYFDETIVSSRERDILRRLLEKKRFVVRD